MRTLPMIFCAGIVWLTLATNTLSAQVLFDEYHGVVSVPIWGPQFRDARDHFTDLRLRGYTAVVATGTYLYPGDEKKTRTSDTIDVVDEMRRLEGLTVDSVVSRDNKNRAYLIAATCDEPPCYDTLRYDDQGRLVSVAGWGYHGSRFLSILYDGQGRVRGYDDDQHGGESVLYTYDAKNRVVLAEYDVRPSDMSDTKRREKFEYTADGLLKRKTVQGNLVGKKVRGQDYPDLAHGEKLVFRAETTYSYLR
ncbi:MAG: hypothetical protein SGJ05_01790 [bacterium]|nr:hypothetical protein [bacterium]